MRLKATLLTTMLLAFSLSCWANALPTVPIESKKAWLANMQKNLPGLLCQKDRYFVQCFETTEPECLELTQLLVKSCLSNVSQNLPNELSAAQVEYWGQVVGRCSYDVYQKMLENKKRNTTACTELPKSKEDLPKPAQAIP